MKFLALVPLCAVLWACGSNCRESVRMGEFEFSQGNYARAEKLYEEALKADPAACADAREKLENTRMFLRR
jgi:tetratricopeptide (TPR) repeat protein